MTAKETLLAHLVSKNQEVLDHYEVTLTVNDLDFTLPEAGEWIEGNNTRIIATMRRGRKVTGSNTYYYSRNDLQEAFSAIGLEEVPCAIEGTPNIANVLNELRTTYNLQLDPNEVIDVRLEGDQFSFGVTERSLLWLNRLTVTIVDAYLIQLHIAFPNNVLDGLIAPFDNEFGLPALAKNKLLNGFDAEGTSA